MLQVAVDTARDCECRSLKSLLSRLNALYPESQADITEAVNYWAAWVKASNPNGVPRN